MTPVFESPDVRLLVVAPNWLGDAVMAMPAVQVLRERLHPVARLDVAAKPGPSTLWRLHEAPAAVWALSPRIADLTDAVRGLRTEAFTHAIFLPNSFRSALAPTLAGIPFRRGTASQGRRLLINDPVDLSACAPRHQQWEMAALLLPGGLPDSLPSPRLSPPEDARAEAAQLLQDLPTPRLGLIPGAARGPSKRWPPERFRAVAEAWLAETRGSVCWLGTPEDAALCDELNQNLGPRARSFAGKSPLPLFAALLEALDAVCANDSGGMHLAAALGTPVIAIFGLTDPAKTGPLHPRAVVVQAPGTRQRNIARDSAAARLALEAVSVSAVLEHVLAIPQTDR